MTSKKDSRFVWLDGDIEIIEEDSIKLDLKRQKEDLTEQDNPAIRGQPLPPWEGQVEITPEDVAEWIVRWNQDAGDEFKGLLEATLEDIEPETEEEEEQPGA